MNLVISFTLVPSVNFFHPCSATVLEVHVKIFAYFVDILHMHAHAQTHTHGPATDGLL